MSRLKQAAGQMRHMSGWKRDKPDHRDQLMTVSQSVLLTETAELPREIPVFDQSDIGSCTANMGCLMMAWIEHKNKQEKTFSRMFLYAKTRELEGTPLTEDSGAQIRDVMKTLAKYGTCEENLWPYIDIHKNFMTAPPSTADEDALNHQALFYYRCASLKSLKQSIVQGFPVGFGFSVPENMMTDEVAERGEVQYPKPTESFDGGHAVTAWGYDNNRKIGDETGAVLCQNSWGVDWGIKGFFWLPYRFFTEHLADDMWTLRRIEL